MADFAKKSLFRRKGELNLRSFLRTYVRMYLAQSKRAAIIRNRVPSVTGGLSATGGMGKQSTTFYKRLASLLAEKWDQSTVQPCTGYVVDSLFPSCDQPSSAFVGLVPPVRMPPDLSPPST